MSQPEILGPSAPSKQPGTQAASTGAVAAVVTYLVHTFPEYAVLAPVGAAVLGGVGNWARRRGGLLKALLGWAG